MRPRKTLSPNPSALLEDGRRLWPARSRLFRQWQIFLSMFSLADNQQHRSFCSDFSGSGQYLRRLPQVFSTLPTERAFTITGWFNRDTFAKRSPSSTKADNPPKATDTLRISTTPPTSPSFASMKTEQPMREPSPQLVLFCNRLASFPLFLGTKCSRRHSLHR